MSPLKKSAAPEAPAGAASARRRQRRVFATGVGLGWALALLAGMVLDGELRALGFLFQPLSALAGGLLALGAWMHFASLADTAKDAVRRWRMRAAFAVLALGSTLLLGLYLKFAVPISYGSSQSIAFLVGSSRSGLCECAPGDEAGCIQEMGLDASKFRSCWTDRWVVELAMALSYLLTLASAGTIAGLLMVPARPPRATEAPQAPQGYLDFDVRIDQTSEGRYRAYARGDEGFEATQFFSLPTAFTGGELCRAGGGSPRGGFGAANATDGADVASPKLVGGELFHTVFQGELLKAFQGNLAKAQGGLGMRIRLRLNEVPQLAGLPWEYLYDGHGFLALSRRTPVVRYPELSEGLRALPVEPPLRVLAVISTPRDYSELAEADEEWRRLGAALEPLRHSGRIEVERLERPTLEALESRLRTGQPIHVLHFVGHGGFSNRWGQGILVFEDGAGKGVPERGTDLADLLQEHPSLRLAVLNACKSARASHADTFAGTAQVLVQHGVPAVIAMQSDVMDETACHFAEQFYKALADGQPVDACVSAARRSLAKKGNPEWGTPVLYLRATDGRLFALEGGDPSTMD